jgi:Uma2 family endonuclease
MSVGTLVPLAEYLSTSYDPDLEYVDGMLVERNVGDWLHSLIQRNLIVALSRKYPHIYAVPELRSKTTETRYRLPDVCVLLSPPTTRYLLDASHIAIEILSVDDSMTTMMEKLAEYQAKGVAHIWLVDPRLELMYIYSSGSLERVDAFRASGGIELTRDELFAQ